MSPSAHVAFLKFGGRYLLLQHWWYWVALEFGNAGPFCTRPFATSQGCPVFIPRAWAQVVVATACAGAEESSCLSQILVPKLPKHLLSRNAMPPASASRSPLLSYNAPLPIPDVVLDRVGHSGAHVHPRSGSTTTARPSFCAQLHSGLASYLSHQSPESPGIIKNRNERPGRSC